MEEKFNELIVLIQAFQNACKDFHYFCHSFSRHLLADEINPDDLYDILDSIKENVFIAEGKDPLHGKEYAKRVAEKTPELKDNDKENLGSLLALITEIKFLVNGMKSEERAWNVILDNVADKMAHAKTLVNIEMRAFEEKISENLDKEENKGQGEKPVDRKGVERAPIDGKKVAKTIKDFEEENLFVAEENTLDKLKKRLDKLEKRLWI
jgi:hypothetical protein